MQNNLLGILGILLIFIGSLGILFTSTNIIGNAISEDKKQFLEFSDIEYITMKENENKIISVNIKNFGLEELTNCKLFVSGQKSEWFYNDETKNIPPESNIDFNLKIKTPENAEINEYLFELQLNCDKNSISKEINLYLTGGVDAIKIREIKSEKNILKIIYTFDNQGFIGDSTYVDIWVKNSDGFEINRINDPFSLKSDNLIIREVEIDLRENPRGVYTVFISHPTDNSNYIKKTIILGDSKTSGKAIFNIIEGKGVPYLAFLIFIAIGIFFIFRSHRKSIQESNK